MSWANNDILLIDDNPSHAKAFGEALIASGQGPSNFVELRVEGSERGIGSINGSDITIELEFTPSW